MATWQFGAQLGLDCSPYRLRSLIELHFCAPINVCIRSTACRQTCLSTSHQDAGKRTNSPDQVWVQTRWHNQSQLLARISTGTIGPAPPSHSPVHHHSNGVRRQWPVEYGHASVHIQWPRRMNRIILKRLGSRIPIPHKPGARPFVSDYIRYRINAFVIWYNFFYFCCWAMRKSP